MRPARIKTSSGDCLECDGNILLAFLFPGIVLLAFLVIAIFSCRAKRMQALARLAFEAEAEDLANEAVAAASNEAVRLQRERSPSAVKLAKQLSAKHAAKWGCTPKRIASLQVKFRILVSLIQVVSQLGVIFSIPYPPF